MCEFCEYGYTSTVDPPVDGPKLGKKYWRKRAEDLDAELKKLTEAHRVIKERLAKFTSAEQGRSNLASLQAARVVALQAQWEEHMAKCKGINAKPREGWVPTTNMADLEVAAVSRTRIQ